MNLRYDPRVAATKNQRPYFGLVVIALLVLSDVLPQSVLTTPMRYTALALVLVQFAWTAVSGYFIRRPHWTPESWRRFVFACAFPILSLLIGIGMESALEFGLPVVGQARSALRLAWGLGTLAFAMYGVIGFSTALFWLRDGDPSSQFLWSPRRFWSRQPQRATA